MADERLDLLTNQAADVNGASFIWPGGRGSFYASATSFGGGTVKLQTTTPQTGTWVDVDNDTTLTANGHGNFDLPPGQIRGVITGSTTPTAVHASAIRIPTERTT